MSLKVSQLTCCKTLFFGIFFLTKIDKKMQLKMKGTSGNSKHNRAKVETNLFLQALDRNFDHLQTHNDCHNLQLFTFIEKNSREKYFVQQSNFNNALRKFYLQI